MAPTGASSWSGGSVVTLGSRSSWDAGSKRAWLWHSAVLNPDAWVGVPGAFGSLIAVAVALLTGPLTAVAVALFGGTLLAVVLGVDGSTDPFLGGAPVIVVWVLAALVTGLISERERRRTAEALETLDHARTDAMQAKSQADAAVARTQRLQALTAELSRAVSVRQVSDAIVRQGVAALEATGGGLRLLSGDGTALELVRSAGYPEELVEARGRVDIDDPVPVAAAVRAGRAIYVESAQMLERRFPTVAAGPRLSASQAWAAVPLMGSAGPLGALALSFDRPRWFDAEDRGMMFGLASQSAQALDRARLYERERGIAEVLQRSFLPETLPQIPMLELDGHYAAGGRTPTWGATGTTSSNSRGGRWPWSSATSPGRGVHAATVMGQLRNAVRAYAIERERPADVIDAVDHLLHCMAPTRWPRCSTASWIRPPACSDTRAPDTHRHCSASRMGRSGSSNRVGRFRSARSWETRSSQGEEVLPEGSTLVLYTDGLVERRDESLEDGLARLRSAVEEAPASASEVRGHLVRVLTSGEHQEDDVALITLRRVAPDARFKTSLPARPHRFRSSGVGSGRGWPEHRPIRTRSSISSWPPTRPRPTASSTPTAGSEATSTWKRLWKPAASWCPFAIAAGSGPAEKAMTAGGWRLCLR